MSKPWFWPATSTLFSLPFPTARDDASTGDVSGSRIQPVATT
ncbi:hypothetical protein [Lysobacter sp. CA199]